jgi:3-dehydroquinate dehydratase-2
MVAILQGAYTCPTISQTSAREDRHDPLRWRPVKYPWRLMQVAVLNGVNLNMLGQRDPEMYGTVTLAQLETMVYGWANDLNATVRCWQTNSEGEYVTMIHEAVTGTDGLIVNPGAWTHYSYAIRDALEIFPRPVVEVHLSDVESREEWRRTSVIADVVSHRILGKGTDGYRLALEHLAEATR